MDLLKGRLLWDNITIENPNQKAVEIGLRQYRRLHEALGLESTTRTEELHSKPVVLRVGLDRNDKERNNIKGYKAYGATPPPAQPVATATPSTPNPVSPSAGDTPWNT